MRWHVNTTAVLTGALEWRLFVDRLVITNQRNSVEVLAYQGLNLIASLESNRPLNPGESLTLSDLQLLIQAKVST